MSDPKMQYGWVCPVCGRGLSPQTTACPCKDIAELFSPYQTTHPKIITTYVNPTPAPLYPYTTINGKEIIE